MHADHAPRSARKARRWLTFALALSWAGCAHGPSAGAPAAPAREFLVRRDDFTACELEGFISLTAARNALLFKSTKASLLDIRSNGPWQRSMIEELYARKERGERMDHPSFAAEKYLQCTERLKVPVARNQDGAAFCLARLDLVFFLDADRQRGRSQEEAIARFKKFLPKGTEGLYPDGLIEKLAPLVFRIRTDDDSYELRRMIFETCLYTDDWMAWYKATGGGKS